LMRDIGSLSYGAGATVKHSSAWFDTGARLGLL
jgi:hypothetical protein